MSSLQTILGNKKYSTLAMVFMTNALLESTWIVYIPYLVDKYEISASLLGLALLCKAIGAFVSMPFSPMVIRKIGEGNTTFVTALLFCLLVPLIVIMPSYLLFCICLFFVGASGGMMDIAMNALVSIREKEDDVYIMSATHGFWSLGGMIGAGIASFVAASLNQPFLHIATLAVLLILMQFVISSNYKNVKSVYEKTKVDFSKVTLSVVVLAMVCLIIMMGEGIVADWSGLYLKNIVFADAAYLGLGYASFAGSMALGRFLSDKISSSMGSRKLIIGGFVISLIGIALVLTGSFILTIIGFMILGFGFSGIVPEAFRLASKLDGISPAQGLALVAGIGYFGFLVGPVLFGYLTDFYDLWLSFLVFLGIIGTSLLLFLLNPSK